MPASKQETRRTAPILVNRGTEPGAQNRTPSAPSWRALGWFGLAVLLVGLVDAALVWYPVRSGNPAWEFGAVDMSISTAPVLLVGLMGLTAATLAGARRWTRVVLGIVAALLAVMVLAGLFVYWTAVPPALSNAPEAAAVGIRKSAARTTLFGLVTLTAFAGSSVVLFRSARTRMKGR